MIFPYDDLKNKAHQQPPLKGAYNKYPQKEEAPPFTKEFTARDKVLDPEHPTAEPLVLVLTPTRELAEQVANHTRQYAKFFEGVKIVEIFGNVSEKAQLEKLQKFGVDVLIATPGRLLSILKDGKEYSQIVPSYKSIECSVKNPIHLF